MSRQLDAGGRLLGMNDESGGGAGVSFDSLLKWMQHRNCIKRVALGPDVSPSIVSFLPRPVPSHFCGWLLCCVGLLR